MLTGRVIHLRRIFIPIDDAKIKIALLSEPQQNLTHLDNQSGLFHQGSGEYALSFLWQLGCWAHSGWDNGCMVRKKQKGESKDHPWRAGAVVPLGSREMVGEWADTSVQLIVAIWPSRCQLHKWGHVGYTAIQIYSNEVGDSATRVGDLFWLELNLSSVLNPFRLYSHALSGADSSGRGVHLSARDHLCWHLTWSRSPYYDYREISIH